MEKPDRSTYTPNDFLSWRETQSIELTPKFQRRGVWKPAARSFFVDTLLRQMPIPPIYLRVVQSPERNRIVRQVVDGQQRVSAVLSFIDGEYRLSRTLAAPWAGKTFEALSQEEQQRITGYGFAAEVFQGISDLEVLEIFARLNTYSVPLNAQELRNGKWFGYFKQAAYALGHEHLEFWRTNKIFTEGNIARMLEVEFVSEVMIAQLAGMQDKKKSIDEFYAKYDEEFSEKEHVVSRFRAVADEISEALSDTLAGSEFRRVPLMYTLFCVLYHHRYGVPGMAGQPSRKPLTSQEQLALREAVNSLSEKIAAARNDEPVPKSYERFVAACLRGQTDNIKPRQERFRTVSRVAFGK
jgi:hypothetical protein